MNKEKFIKMLEQAKEDEYGRLYVIGDCNNKIYFGTITTICEDIFEGSNRAEIYDRHFWNDDTLECFVVSTKHDEDIEYKEPKRIEELNLVAPTNYMKYMQDKINELVRISNKYARLLEKVECDE
jgi:hypothetical protein